MERDFRTYGWPPGVSHNEERLGCERGPHLGGRLWLCHGSKDGSCHSDLLSPDIPLLHSFKLLRSRNLQQPGKLLGGRVDEELALKQAGVAS